MKKIHKLTPQMLYRLVLEEKAKYEKDLEKVAAATKEVDADEYANTLEKEVDFLAVLKIKEVQAKSDLKKIEEAKKRSMLRLREARSAKLPVKKSEKK
jgi:hypothetical protein